MTEPNALARPLSLPCGATLHNRIAKAAMTEGLADADDRATERHETLYRRWSQGGAGLLITGNVMVDRRYLERPGNVVIDVDHIDDHGREALARWAEAGTCGGNHLWMQISHPGRQCTRMSSGSPVAPSPVPLQGMMGLIAAPRSLSHTEICGIIERWARVAGIAKESGFTGVQVHGAHGYLASQFLSPRVNLRQDEWGGSLEKRARFLLETVKAVRAEVGAAFPVAVKLNSADFQKGGFDNAESAQVAQWLGDLGIDLLEISGGNYEQPALMGAMGDEKRAESTRRREAYFLDYAENIRAACPGLPLMLTGGFRTAAAMKDAIESGAVDVVGVARPFCVQPHFANGLMAEGLDRLPAHERELSLGAGMLGRGSHVHSIRTLNAQAEAAWFYAQILHLGEGREPDTTLGTWAALAQHFRGEFARSRARSRRR